MALRGEVLVHQADERRRGPFLRFRHRVLRVLNPMGQEPCRGMQTGTRPKTCYFRRNCQKMSRHARASVRLSPRVRPGRVLHSGAGRGADHARRAQTRAGQGDDQRHHLPNHDRGVGGRAYIGARREAREAPGVAAGEPLTVVLEYDPELRTVDLPEALRAKLEADPKAAAAFEKLSYTRKKEFVQWITGAKLAERQRRRLAEGMAMLRGSGRR